MFVRVSHMFLAAGTIWWGYRSGQAVAGGGGGQRVISVVLKLRPQGS